MRRDATNWTGKAKWMALMFLLATAAATAQTTPDERKRLILVSIAERKLALIEDGQVKKVYAVAVGARRTPSPTGQFKVVNRLVRPTYYRPGQVIPAGAQNPLGTRWMGLNQKGYGIHGTNAPRSIGKAASHGCIRMAKGDLEELFEQVRVGDAVEIRGGVDELTAAVFGERLEVADAGRMVAGGAQ